MGIDLHVGHIHHLRCRLLLPRGRIRALRFFGLGRAELGAKPVRHGIPAVHEQALRRTRVPMEQHAVCPACGCISASALRSVLLWPEASSKEQVRKRG
jgi:hypothetical protein